MVHDKNDFRTSSTLIRFAMTTSVLAELHIWVTLHPSFSVLPPVPHLDVKSSDREQILLHTSEKLAPEWRKFNT